MLDHIVFLKSKDGDKGDLFKVAQLSLSKTSLNPAPDARVCVFDGTYYKITTTNYISKTFLYITLLGSFWGNLFSLFQLEIYIFSTHSNIFV